MDPQTMLFFADLVLVVHAALALFLALGLAAILVGGPLKWNFVRNRRFRAPHLTGMAVVAAESLLGLTCPLTDLESSLRASAQAPGYSESFIAHLLGGFLFYDFDERVFAVVYLAALGLTLWSRRWCRAVGKTSSSPPPQAP